MVIFTTAHDEHAIRAFEVNALDYLLKPYTEERFRLAVQRAREQVVSAPGRRREAQLAGCSPTCTSPPRAVDAS